MYCTLDGESDINHQDHWLRTPLYLAVIKGGHIEVVMFVSSFLYHSAIISEKFFTDIVQTVLQKENNYICYYIKNVIPLSFQVKELLKQSNIDVNLKSIYLKTALMRAIEEKHDDIVHEILSKEGLDPNVQDNYGQTALMYAVKRNKIKIVKQMLNLCNIDLNQTDNAGRTALVHANNKGYMQIVESLMLQKSVRESMDLTGPNR